MAKKKVSAKAKTSKAKSAVQNKKTVASKTKGAKIAKKSAAKVAKKLSAKSNVKASVKVLKKAPKKTVAAKKSQPVQTTKSMAGKSIEKKSQASFAKGLSAADLKMMPLDDRLLVQVEVKEKKTAGGLFIPETAAVSGNYEGKVLAVGRGHMNKKGKIKSMDVQIGDVVLFSEYAGQKYSQNGLDLRILRESDVLGVISEK